MYFLLFAFCSLIATSNLTANSIQNIGLSVHESISKIDDEISKLDNFKPEMELISNEISAYRLTYSDLIASATSGALTKEDMDKAKKDLKVITSKINNYAGDIEERIRTLKQFYAATLNAEASYMEIVSKDKAVGRHIAPLLTQFNNRIAVFNKKLGETEEFSEKVKTFNTTINEWNDIISGSIRLAVSKTTFKWDKDKVFFSAAVLQNIGKELLRIHYVFHEIIADSDIGQPKTRGDALLFISVLVIIILTFAFAAFFFVKPLKGRAYDINIDNFIIIALVNSLIVHRWAVMFLTFILSISAAYIMILNNIPKLFYITVLSIVGSVTIWRVGLQFIRVILIEKHGQLEKVNYEHRVLIGNKLKSVYTVLCILALLKVPKYAYQISGDLYHSIYFTAFAVFIFFTLILLWKLDIKSFAINQTRRVRFFAGITRLLFLCLLFLVLCSVILEGAGFVTLSYTVQKIFMYNFTTVILAWLAYMFGSEFINLYYLSSARGTKIPLKDSIALRDLSQLLLNSTLLISSMLLIIKAWTTYIFIVPSIMNLSVFTLVQFDIKLRQVMEIITCYFGLRILYVAATYTWDLFVFDYLNIEKKFQANFYALTKYSLILLFFIISGSIFGITYKNLLIIAGALGVGIGFGLQNIANNFISGIILLFERPIRVGDILEIDGKYVTVTHIGSRSTTVYTFNNSSIVIPNSEIISNKLINWTLADNIMALNCEVEVDYGSDLDKVINIIMDVLNNNKRVLKDPDHKKGVYMTGFGDNGIKFRVEFRIDNPNEILSARSSVLLDINGAFEKAGIKIPYPHREVYINSAKS